LVPARPSALVALAAIAIPAILVIPDLILMKTE
jgi:hypothetical protein